MAPISGGLGKPRWHSLPVGTATVPASLGSVFGFQRIRYKLWSSESHTGAHGAGRLRTLGLLSLEMRKHHSTFQDLKGPTGKLERYSPSGTGVSGHGTMGSNWKRGNLEGKLEKKFFTNWGWWSRGTGSPEKSCGYPIPGETWSGGKHPCP